MNLPESSSSYLSTIRVRLRTLYVVVDPTKPCDLLSPLLARAVGDAVAALFGLRNGSEFAQLFQCEFDSRLTMLQQLLGNVTEDEVHRLLQEAGVAAPPETTVVDLPQELAEQSRLAESKPAQVREAPHEGSEDIRDPWEAPSAIRVTKVEKQPPQPTNHIDLKITTPGTGGKGTRQLVQTGASGEVGELLAMQFERDQGRFPIRIGHVTGYRAPGCDILSFASVEDAERFEKGPRDAALIQRFIEAKARTGLTIELKGNELTAARNWRDRYYLYRFRAAEHGFELTTLRNPLACPEAQTSVLELSIDKASTAEHYKIVTVSETGDPIRDGEI